MFLISYLLFLISVFVLSRFALLVFCLVVFSYLAISFFMWYFGPTSVLVLFVSFCILNGGYASSLDGSHAKEGNHRLISGGPPHYTGPRH